MTVVGVAKPSSGSQVRITSAWQGVPLVTVLCTFTVTLAAQLSVKVGVTGKLTALRHWLVSGPGTLSSTEQTAALQSLIRLTCVLLVQPSSATQVRITSAWHGVPLVTVLCTFTVTLAAQLSVKVGVTGKLSVPRVWLVSGPGTLSATGAIVSCT